MKHSILSALACALLASTLPAAASPVTVSAGESVVFNFSGTAPVGADEVTLATHIQAFNAADGTYNFYPNLDAGGTPWSLMTAPIGLSQQSFVPSGPGAAPAGFMDGQFSMLLSVTQGSITIDPTATLFTDRDVGTVYSVSVGNVPTRTLDEPSAMALFAVVGAGIAATRRRVAAG